MVPHGLLSFPLTPFAPDGGLDLDALAAHLEDQVAHGPGAVFVACGTGEGAALSPGEWSAVLRRSVDVVAGRVPVWVGAGGGVGTAREQAAEAGSAGADGVLLMPPYLVQGPEAGVVAHIRAVTDAGGPPLVVYRRGTAKLGPDAVLALLDLAGVVGLKDGFGDTRTVDALLTTFYLPLARLRDTTPGYAVALVKEGARQRGVPVGPVRPPLVDVTEEHAAQLRDLVSAGRAVLAAGVSASGVTR